MIKNDSPPTNSQMMIDLNNNENSHRDICEVKDNSDNNNNNSNNNNNNNNSMDLKSLNDNNETIGAYITESSTPLIQQISKTKVSPILSSSPSPSSSSSSANKKLKSKYKNSPPLLSKSNDFNNYDDDDDDDDDDNNKENDLDTFRLDSKSTKSTTSLKNIIKSSLTNSRNMENNNNNNNNNKIEIEEEEEEKDLSYLKKVEKQENIEENGGEDMLLVDRMVGYESNKSREFIYWLTILFSCGVSLLVYYWFELLYINIRFKKSLTISNATHVLVYSKDLRFEFSKVNYITNDDDDDDDRHTSNQYTEKYIIYRFSRFFFNEKIQEYEKTKLVNQYEKIELLRLVENGLSRESLKRLKQRFGENEINFPVKNIPRLLMEEVLHPFFIFQIYSVCLWIAEQYYYYAAAIFLIATVSAIISLREIRGNLLSLQKISHFVCSVDVLRNNGEIETISSTELVPGDIIELRQDFIMPCDVILLSGQAILNESMLTGESIPVNKYSVLSDEEIKLFKQQQQNNNNNNNNYITQDGSNNNNEEEIKDLSKEKRSLIYGGTVVVKLLSSTSTNDKIFGMVRDTSFQTTKGKLILSILYPKKSHFKFFMESLKFVGVLCVLAFAGFCISVWRLKTLGVTNHIIALRALDLITIVVPPALPMAMTVGTGFGLSRLRKSKIFCISPPRLNMAGKIQVFCFDKTGTLTEEGLDLLGIISTSIIINNNNGGSGNNNSNYNNNNNNNNNYKSLSIPSSPLSISKSPQSLYLDSRMTFSSLPNSPTINSSNNAANGSGAGGAGGSGGDNNGENYYYDMINIPTSANVSMIEYKFNEMNDPKVTSFNNNQGMFRLLMSTCHSLTVINGSVSGDPLEIKIFESTNSTILDGTTTGSSGQVISMSPNEFLSQEIMVSYLENFDFQSKLQRMSVIVQLQSSGRCFSLVKGSPEMIKNLCIPQTIPKDYDSQLAIYTEKGYRVLACAYRKWDPTFLFPKRDILRKESESNLEFLGFIIMENRIKPQSPPIIKKLQKANIRTVMVTGDNGLTATSVAKQCGIIKNDSILFMGLIQPSSTPTPSTQTNVASTLYTNSNNDSSSSVSTTTSTTAIATKGMLEDEIIWEHVSQEGRGDIHKLDPNTLLLDDENRDYNLIVTGPVFKQIYNHYLATGSTRFVNMLRRGVVYARMTPDEKQSLIEELERIGLYVGMCGDGANDCGALKAAHVGISLSESEASIAAPFTSTITDISCVPTLIREGRASLAVSFKLFQFMGMYSLIQFTSVIFLYFHASVLGNWQYLYQDLFVIFPLVIFLGMTEPCEKLSLKRPSGRLISGAIIGSLFVHILVCVSYLLAIYLLVQTKSWFDEIILDDQNIRSYITTSLFIFGSFQYSIMLFTFSFGKPFLKPFYTNKYLFMVYIFTLTTNLILLFGGFYKVWDFLQLRVLPVSWRFTMFAFIVGNLVSNALVEFFFYLYKSRSKKKKILNITKIFSKNEDDIPKDSRISENSVLIPIHNN
ncbi:hypothetical protein ACTFIW_007299 [Dictyostelium discoideum]